MTRVKISSRLDSAAFLLCFFMLYIASLPTSVALSMAKSHRGLIRPRSGSIKRRNIQRRHLKQNKEQKKQTPQPSSSPSVAPSTEAPTLTTPPTISPTDDTSSEVEQQLNSFEDDEGNKPPAAPCFAAMNGEVYATNNSFIYSYEYELLISSGANKENATAFIAHQAQDFLALTLVGFYCGQNVDGTDNLDFPQSRAYYEINNYQGDQKIHPEVYGVSAGSPDSISDNMQCDKLLESAPSGQCFVVESSIEIFLRDSTDLDETTKNGVSSHVSEVLAMGFKSGLILTDENLQILGLHFRQVISDIKTESTSSNLINNVESDSLLATQERSKWTLPLSVIIPLLSLALVGVYLIRKHVDQKGKKRHIMKLDNHDDDADDQDFIDWFEEKFPSFDKPTNGKTPGNKSPSLTVVTEVTSSPTSTVDPRFGTPATAASVSDEEAVEVYIKNLYSPSITETTTNYETNNRSAVPDTVAL